MKLKKGDRKLYPKVVGEEDLATFHGENVHPFYATFALARDMEWASRLFVLDIKDADEEGIGTYLKVRHYSPARLGEEVMIEAVFEKMRKNEIICIILAKVGDRLVAEGETGQKIIKKKTLKALY